MTNDELYLKISQIINTAFKEQENRDEAMEGRLNHRMDVLESRMDRFDEKLDHVEETLNAKIDNLDAKIDGVESSLNVKIDNLDAKIDGVESSLNVKIDNLDAKIDGIQDHLEGQIHLINLNLENEITPRLTHIENCYVAVSERYLESTNKSERMQIDIDVLKSVVGKHEKILCGVPA